MKLQNKILILKYLHTYIIKNKYNNHKTDIEHQNFLSKLHIKCKV